MNLDKGVSIWHTWSCRKNTQRRVTVTKNWRKLSTYLLYQAINSFCHGHMLLSFNATGTWLAADLRNAITSKQRTELPFRTTACTNQVVFGNADKRSTTYSEHEVIALLTKAQCSHDLAATVKIHQRNNEWITSILPKASAIVKGKYFSRNKRDQVTCHGITAMFFTAHPRVLYNSTYQEANCLSRLEVFRHIDKLRNDWLLGVHGASPYILSSIITSRLMPENLDIQCIAYDWVNVIISPRESDIKYNTPYPRLIKL